MSAASTSNAQVVDPEELPPAAAVPSTELAVAATRHAIIQAHDPAEILTKAGAIAAELKSLIEGQGLFLEVNGKRHVEVGGWQACGALVGALGGTPLHADTRWGPRRTDSELEEYEACVEIRTLEGTVVGSAVGSCSRGESKWSNRDSYALRSMAETRAESRAYRRAVGWLVHIAGYSTTPAEEMPSESATPAAANVLPWGPKVNKEHAALASTALQRLAGPHAKSVWDDAKQRHGYMPLSVADAYVHLARVLELEEAAAV